MDSFENKLYAFAVESNRLANIDSTQADDDMAEALETFVVREELNPLHVIEFAGLVGAELRDKPGMDLRLGRQTPPPGGAIMTTYLGDLLLQANQRTEPFHVHCLFEWVHPFTDGNGRIGRAIWAWQMVTHFNSGLPIGFARQFYLQTLENYSENASQNYPKTVP